MNDIRTVYELQDEETVTQNGMETLIQKPTPSPDLDESKITVQIIEAENNKDDSIIMKEGGSFEEINEYDKDMRKISPKFPVNYVSKHNLKNQNSIQKESEGNQSSLQESNSYNQFKMNSIHISGKSFGSKCYSRKVSPHANTLRIDHSSIGTFSSDNSESSEEKKVTQKEIMIENLNSFSSQFRESFENPNQQNCLNSTTTNELKTTHLSDRYLYRDFDNNNKLFVNLF